MTILEKIDKIENLLNEYTNQAYSEEDLTSLKASVDEIKAEIEAEKQAEPKEQKKQTDETPDEHAEWLFGKYAVNNTGKDRYTGNVNDDADALIERMKSDKIDTYNMQKSARKY